MIADVGEKYTPPVARRSIPVETETKLLISCARRCALCYGLEGQLFRKQGQIAHADQEANNNAESNLVFLCLHHHDEYDSATSQSKGITKAELLEYKRQLLIAITAKEHIAYSQKQLPEDRRREAIENHDKSVFSNSDAIMNEAFITSFIECLRSDDSCNSKDLQTLDSIRSYFSETGNQYIDEDLSEKLNGFLATLDALLLFIAKHFFVFPDIQDREDGLRLCMYPELNVDRRGPGTPDSIVRYNEFGQELERNAVSTIKAYQEYRHATKSKLII